jgi:hypothetical protein
VGAAERRVKTQDDRYSELHDTLCSEPSRTREAKKSRSARGTHNDAAVEKWNDHERLGFTWL